MRWLKPCPRPPSDVTLLPPFVYLLCEHPVPVIKLCRAAAALGASLEAPSCLPVIGLVSRGAGVGSSPCVLPFWQIQARDALPSIEMPCLSPVEEEQLSAHLTDPSSWEHARNRTVSP